ncbi:MAG: sigma-70 family RNA polymerase sigma factor [Lewinellaceae bacterium]|nr:sigma-70 family RNA polymerase sigma factor [Lewinella sp.]MCB9278890.1 sigma-70 family RNA polymerase sigma factor [Lewinellaceae bacterium]
MDPNAQEWHWLINSPEVLLKHYQPVIVAAVNRFVARGFFGPEERDELVQEVNLQLLEKKLGRMKEQYSGAVRLKTYFAKVVQNAVLEMIRSRRRQPDFLDEEALTHRQAEQLHADEKLIIRDELLRLEAALKNWPNRYRTLLTFKIWTRSLLQRSDVQFYIGPATEAAIEKLLRTCSSPYDNLNEGTVFNELVELFNALENKDTDGDSLRRWNNQQADRLIEILNGDPPVSRHTRESLRILLRMHFDQ